MTVLYYILEIPQGLWDQQTQADRQDPWYPAEKKTEGNYVSLFKPWTEKKLILL